MGELILLMGPTGSGKSTQGDLLAQELNGVHLSSGQLLRQDPQSAAQLKTGNLAPAEEVHRVVGEALEQVPEETPVILDGTPRTESDLKWLQENLERLKRTVTHVVVLDFDIETSLKRLSGRDREDDSLESIRKKYDWYNNMVRPVIEHYERVGLLTHVDGRGTIEDVYAQVKAAVR